MRSSDVRHGVSEVIGGSSGVKRGIGEGRGGVSEIERGASEVEWCQAWCK